MFSSCCCFNFSSIFIIDRELLSKAIKTTSEARKSNNLFVNLDLAIEKIKNDKTIKSLWEKYQNEYSYASNISWDEVISSIQKVLEGINKHL